MKKFSNILCVLLAVAMLAGLAAGCNSTSKQEPAPTVVLTVAGAWEDCKAIEEVGRVFTAQYPNCTIRYEYLQDYDAALIKRMSGENAVDLFFANNIQADSEMLPYAQELLCRKDLDLSSTFDGLIDNFILFGDDDAAAKQLYAIPLGAEMRGLYINKTLLDSLSIPIPTDQASLLAACEALKRSGYIPFHGNPGAFAQTLLYPWVCNLVANAPDPAAAYEKVNSRADGLGEMFKEPYEFLYTLIENGYYDYKRAQTDLNLFNDASDIGYSRDFFNIRQNGDTWEKADDIGQVAFMPSPISMRGVMDKVKEDYHSGIEYVFVPAPVGPDGGFAYMSPARGIAANKSSANLEWSIKFLNFLFTPKNNEIFAEEFSIIPNTEDAFNYISTLFDMPDQRISQLGQVTFDYGFYGIITESLVDVSKANNPKYMQENPDGSVSLYPLEYYLAAFEEAIKSNGE